jgi:transcriptional regulator with XRE-family HTH domain
MSFGAVLREYRMGKGVSQRQLAMLSTVSIRAIRDLEVGKASRPRKGTTELLATGLGLTGPERAGFLRAARQVAYLGARTVGHDAEPVPAAGVLAPLAPITETVGRHAELGVLRELLAGGSQRLITLTGLAGVGKTALALETALALPRYLGFPVLWSPADAADPRLATLQRGAETSLLLAPDATAADLGALIGSGPALLVRDGYVPAATRPDPVPDLLRRCPGLRVLTTARAPSGAPGERVWPVPSLGLPAGPADRTAPAVRLLVAVIRRLRPDFALTASDTVTLTVLCRLLDGVPAALVAAAGRFLAEPSAALLDQARTDPFVLLGEGAPGLREALAQAVAGLGEAEAAALTRLAELAGGWTVPEAATLSGLPAARCGWVVRRLHALGLVRPVGDRLRVLNLVRAYLRLNRNRILQ